MLTNTKELLVNAQKNKKAIGAFNCPSLEAIRATIKAAEELNSPVILQHAQSHDPIIEMEEMLPIYMYYAKRARVPVSVHLDHGCTFEKCIMAIRMGVSSIMYDASAKDFETNIEETKYITEIAHAAGVSVEAELGHVGSFSSSDEGGGEDDEGIYTNPDSAYEFVTRTGVDFLAISFGTTHGVYLTEPKLDIDRVKTIKDKIGIPLVMHGGSGVSEEDYIKSIKNGISKINYYTYMNCAGGEGIHEYIKKNPDNMAFDKMSLYATDKMQEDVKRAISIFNFIS